jgi:hypothetical protein
MISIVLLLVRRYLLRETRGIDQPPSFPSEVKSSDILKKLSPANQSSSVRESVWSLRYNLPQIYITSSDSSSYNGPIQNCFTSKRFQKALLLATTLPSIYMPPKIQHTQVLLSPLPIFEIQKSFTSSESERTVHSPWHMCKSIKVERGGVGVCSLVSPYQPIPNFAAR